MGALQFIDALLEFLGQKNKRFSEVLRESYLTCVQVLQAAGDPRASEVLEMAFIHIQEMANKIKDPEMRGSFLENVPYNREIVRLWQEQGN